MDLTYILGNGYYNPENVPSAAAEVVEVVSNTGNTGNTNTGDGTAGECSNCGSSGGGTSGGIVTTPVAIQPWEEIRICMPEVIQIEGSYYLATRS